MSEDRVPNEDRGEVAITLAGKSYIMRPTFQAIRQSEKLAGCSFMMLMQKAMRLDLSLDDLAAVIMPGLKEGGEAGATFEKVLELAYRTGINDSARAVIPYMSNAIMGGRPMPKEGDGEGEAQAAGETNGSRAAAISA